ncbi:MAG TPA: SRPBCC domain-containing protein [Caulobacteraceae bacterium]|jgi:uncharacterized protein YndB with AHSA1/START domain|nr:SRPBCC domain-containing protein [Caulobacteraceae bacterium]
MAEAELARFIDRWTMEYVRVYPHPIERVWRAITDPAELARWFIPPTKWELKVGATFRFHDDGFMGKVEALEPPRRVRFGNAADDGGYFEYELTEVPGGARLRFVNHFAPGGDWAETPGDLGGDLPAGPGTPWKPGFVGGWHEFWDALADFLDGVPTGSRLPATDMSVLVDAWVAEVEVSYGMSPKLGVRIKSGLRRKERWNELNQIYRDHIAATCPPASEVAEGDRT